MTLACPVDLDSMRLRREGQDMYARVAAAPGGTSQEATARKFGVIGVNLSGVRA